MLLIAVVRADWLAEERTGVAGSGLIGGVSNGRGEDSDSGEQLVLNEDDCAETKDGMNLYNR